MGTPEVVESTTCADHADHDAPVRIHIRTIIVVAAICSIYFATLVGIVGAGLLAQPIGGLFHDTARSSWFAPMIVIMTAILNLPLAQAADYWGRKWIVVITTTLAFVGCIVISRANMDVVIAGFCILGAGFGSQSSLLAVVSEVLPRKQRPIGQGIATGVGGLGGVIGIVMGGSLLRYGHPNNFRIYFYVNAAILAAAGFACAVCYKPPARELQKSLTQMEKLRKLDWIGYALFSPGLTLFCLALGWSQNPYGWKDAHILATFVVGVVLLAAFILYEWRMKLGGLLYHDLFSSKNFCIAFATIFVEGLSFFTTNTYFAFEVSVLQRTDLLISGMHFGILFITSAVFALLSGFYSKRRKTVREPLVVGFLGLLIFNVLMATVTPRTPANALWCYPLIGGLGLGCILPISMAAAQLSTPAHLIALATGLIISVRTVGAAIGLAVNDAIFNATLSTNIPAKIAAATLPLGLPLSSLGAFIGALASKNVKALEKIPGVTPQIIAAGGAAQVEAYGIGFRNVWIAAACFSLVAVVAAFFFTDPLSEFNAHIDAPAEIRVLREQEQIEKGHGRVDSEHVEDAKVTVLRE